MLLGRQENIFKVALFYLPDQSIVTKITKDAKMSVSDKISWVGGMMGLFTGFSVISGLEILYWLWFKVVFNKQNKVGVEQDKRKISYVEEEESKQLAELRGEVAALRTSVAQMSAQLRAAARPKTADGPQPTRYFDAIFNDVEAQQTLCGIME